MKKYIFIPLLLLIASFSYGQILNGSLTGSLESNNIYYLNDNGLPDYSQPENPFGSNSFFKFDYRTDMISAGIQYEAYLPPTLELLEQSPSMEGNKLTFRYFQFQNKSLKITAGNFYEQFGSGLIFRAYEERAIGINTALDGVNVHYSPTNYLRLKAVWGKQRKYLENGNGTVKGIDGDFDVLTFLNPESNKLLTIGGSWVNKYEPYTGPDEDFPKSIDAWATRLQFEAGRFSLYSEFIEKAVDPRTDNENTPGMGNALLINSSYTANQLGIIVSFRSLKNMDFRSERNAIGQVSMINYLPALTKLHTYTLASLYPYGAQGKAEFGGQIDIFYRFKKNSAIGGKYGMKIAINASYYKNLSVNDAGYAEFLNPGDKKLFQDINIEVEKKFSKKLKTNFSYVNMEYNKGAILSGGDKLIKSQVAIADIKYKFSRKLGLKTEIQHLWTKQDEKNWILGLLELSFAPKWSVFVSDMYNYQYSEDVHYVNGGFSFSKGTTRFALSAGRHKEGLKCEGGVCLYTPKYTGLQATLVTAF